MKLILWLLLLLSFLLQFSLMIKVLDHHIIYTNVIQLEPNQEISRAANVQFEVTCNMSRDGSVSASISARPFRVRGTIHGSGEVHPEMSLYTSKTFQTMVIRPTYRVNEPVYLGVQILPTNQDLKPILGSCLVTDYHNTRSHPLLDHG